MAPGATQRSPFDGIRPRSAFTSVDLPSPLAPKMPTLSPFWMSRSTPERTVLPSYSTLRFLVVMTFFPDLWAAWILTVISLFFSGFSFSSILAMSFSLVLWVVMYHWSAWSCLAISSCFFFWVAYFLYSFSILSRSIIFFMMKSE